MFYQYKQSRHSKSTGTPSSNSRFSRFNNLSYIFHTMLYCTWLNVSNQLIRIHMGATMPNFSLGSGKNTKIWQFCHGMSKICFKYSPIVRCIVHHHLCGLFISHQLLISKQYLSSSHQSLVVMIIKWSSSNFQMCTIPGRMTLQIHSDS